MKYCGHTVVALMATHAILCVSYLSPAYAWVGYSYCGTPGTYIHWASNESIEVRLDPGVANPQTGEPVAWTTHELSIIRAALGTYNHVTTSRLHFHISDTECDGPGGGDTGTVCLWKVQHVNYDATTSPTYNPVSCSITKATIRIQSPATSIDALLYHHMVHEIGHAVGITHTANAYDWMSSTTEGVYGGQHEHLGMTRDFRNAISYIYPFGHNFFFGLFDELQSGGGTYTYRKWYTDILTRQSQGTTNAIPWYLASMARSAAGAYTVLNMGEYSDDGDFGDQNTLPYVVGNFTGSGGDDIAAGLCSSPDPGDGSGDTITWYVMKSTSENSTGFQSTSIWENDFGNAGDYDLYLSGNFTALDDCDDLLLIRNSSTYDCDASTGECTIRLYVLPAEDADNPKDGECDYFGNFYYYDLEVSDRSATTSWPWVVGDFYTSDGLGCADIAFGEPSQSDPLDMDWHVVRGKDTNSDGRCDTLELMPSLWATGIGDQGQVLWFSGDFGAPYSYVGDDLVRVKVGDDTVSWWVMYSNGSSAFTNGHTAVSNMHMGEDVHFRGKIFGVGNMRGTQANIRDDFIALVDNRSDTDSLRIYYASNNGGAPTSTWSSYYINATLDQMVWDQATDWDDWNWTLDNGGDDVRLDWFGESCDVWYNITNQ